MMAGNQDADGKQNPADIMTMFFTLSSILACCEAIAVLIG